MVTVPVPMRLGCISTPNVMTGLLKDNVTVLSLRVNRVRGVALSVCGGAAQPPPPPIVTGFSKVLNETVRLESASEVTPVWSGAVIGILVVEFK
jgi:hypothetical protein